MFKFLKNSQGFPQLNHFNPHQQWTWVPNSPHSHNNNPFSLNNSLFFFRFFFHRGHYKVLSRALGCYTVIILYTEVCRCQYQSPNLSLPHPYPLVIINLLSTSATVLLFYRYVHLQPFLFKDSTYKPYHMIFILLSQTYFTQYNNVYRPILAANGAVLFFLWLSNIPLGFLGRSAVKNMSAKQDMQIWSPGWENPLEKEKVNHSCILAWEIPWIEKPGGLQFKGSPKSWKPLSNRFSLSIFHRLIGRYHSSADDHLGCFHVLAIVNSAAMNIGVHVSFWIMVFFGYISRSGPAGS